MNKNRILLNKSTVGFIIFLKFLFIQVFYFEQNVKLIDTGIDCGYMVSKYGSSQIVKRNLKVESRALRYFGNLVKCNVHAIIFRRMDKLKNYNSNTYV